MPLKSTVEAGFKRKSPVLSKGNNNSKRSPMVPNHMPVLSKAFVVSNGAKDVQRQQKRSRLNEGQTKGTETTPGEKLIIRSLATVVKKQEAFSAEFDEFKNGRTKQKLRNPSELRDMQVRLPVPDRKALEELEIILNVVDERTKLVNMSFIFLFIYNSYFFFNTPGKHCLHHRRKHVLRCCEASF